MAEYQNFYDNLQKRFVQDVLGCKNNMHYITLTEEELSKIDCFVRKVIEKKCSEGHHIIDGGQEYKRFFTGTMGEVAIEKFFNVRFIDWSIGDSNDYNKADLLTIGLNVGIKTVEMYKHPIVHKVPHRPELINIRRNRNTIILCGLATVPVLRQYQDDSLILSPALRNRGTKSGFYGFDHLIKVDSFIELKKIIATY